MNDAAKIRRMKRFSTDPVWVEKMAQHYDKIEADKIFNEWLFEIENFGTRYERMLAHGITEECLREAYELGRNSKVIEKIDDLDQRSSIGPTT